MYKDTRGPFLQWLRPRGYRGELLVGPFYWLAPGELLYRGAVWLNTLGWRWER